MASLDDERIRSLILERAKVSPRPAALTPEMSLRDLGIDSLALVSLLTRCGEELDVEPDELIEALADVRIETVADIVTMARRLGRGS